LSESRIIANLSDSADSQVSGTFNVLRTILGLTTFITRIPTNFPYKCFSPHIVRITFTTLANVSSISVERLIAILQ
jgi:hypothetical protein